MKISRDEVRKLVEPEDEFFVDDGESLIIKQAQKVKSDWETPTKDSAGQMIDMPLLLKTIYHAYLGKYMNIPVDKKGKELNLSYFPIVRQKVRLQMIKEDIDSIDGEFISKNIKHQAQDLVLNIAFDEWKNKHHWGSYLNKLQTKAVWGTVITKVIKKGGDIHLDVVNPFNIMLNPLDFEQNLGDSLSHRIHSDLLERQIYSEEEVLTDKRFDKDKVKALVDQETDEIDITYTKSDISKGEVKTHGYELYEYHHKTEEGWEFSIISLKHELVLYTGTLKESPYYALHHEKSFLRGQGLGAVEDLLEAQKGVNKAMIQRERGLDSATTSQLVTDSAKINNNRNVLGHGSILKVNRGDKAEWVTAHPTGLGETSEQIGIWKQQGNEVTSVTDTNTGQTLPSGTSWGLASQLLVESNRLHDQRREETALFLEELVNNEILPHLKKKVSKLDFIINRLSINQYQMLKQTVASKMMNDKVFELMMSDEPMEQDTMQMIQEEMVQKAESVKNIKITLEKGFWDGYSPVFAVTDENLKKKTLLSDINTVLQLKLQNPEIENDPYYQYALRLMGLNRVI